MGLFGRIFGGKGTMAALSAGTKAPLFELPAMDGSRFSLQDALTQGPVLAIFFKVSCPVCQYALPYFERIYKAYGGKKLAIVGISQNEKSETAEFMRKFGVNFPVLLDDTKKFPVSNAYGLTTVPTAFWIETTTRLKSQASAGCARNSKRLAPRLPQLQEPRGFRCFTRRRKSPISAQVETLETSPRSRTESLLLESTLFP